MISVFFRIENIVEGCYQHFFPFSTMFSELPSAEPVKNCVVKSLSLSQTSTNVFKCLQYQSFENITCNEQFLLFPQCILPLTLSQTNPCFHMSAVWVFWEDSWERVTENFMPFSSNLKLSSAKFFSSEESKICSLGKGYRELYAIFIKFKTVVCKVFQFGRV